jgi:uncharacterized Zn finger protein
MKTRVANARRDNATCPRCHTVNYNLEPPTFNGGKPMFRCNDCGHLWCHGYSGGTYTKYAIRG